MLGLHILPYDRVINGGQGRNMTSPSSTLFESSSIDRHLIGSVNSSIGFRAYHRPAASPSSFADPFDLVSSSEEPFNYRYRAILENAASSAEHQLTNSRRLPPPLSSAGGGFVEQFNGYGVVPTAKRMSYQSGQGPCNQQQHSIFDDPQQVRGHVKALQLHHQQQQSQQHIQPHRRLQQQLQPTVDATLRSLPSSSFDVVNADHLQQRRLVSDHHRATSSLTAVPTFFRSDEATIAAASTADAVSTATIGGCPLTSTSTSFDFYYGGCGSPPSYRSSIEAPPTYRDVPPVFDPAVVTPSNAQLTAGALVRASVVPPVIPSSTTLPPIFRHKSTAVLSPPGAVVSSAKVSTSTTSSLSSSGSLTVDETTTNSGSPSSPRILEIDESREHRQLRGQPPKQRRRRRAVAVPPDRKDIAYYERRKKNNESARRSRESRQSKEQSTIDECHEAREHNTKIKIQIQLLQREYNEMCQSAYGRIGPVAASRLIAPPPPSTGYGYHLPSPGEAGSYPMLLPPNGIVDDDRT